MQIPFIKYSATGNTFLAFDGRKVKPGLISPSRYLKLSKEYGVDGFLFVEDSDIATFKMTYLNADGGEVEMCGNGGRAITLFASKELGFSPDENGVFKIQTMNGIYESRIGDVVEIKMTEIGEPKEIDISDLFSSTHSAYLQVGVPHTIFQVEDVEKENVMNAAPKIRQDKRFAKGTNVNFFEILEDGKIKLRTYERGVEGETLSCGTGATATSIFAAKTFGWKDKVEVETRGGTLEITFDDNFENVYLRGPVQLVETGILTV